MKAFEKNSQVDCEIEMAVTVQGVLGAAIDASICSLPQPQLPQSILWVRHDQTGLTITTSSGGLQSPFNRVLRMSHIHSAIS